MQDRCPALLLHLKFEWAGKEAVNFSDWGKQPTANPLQRVLLSLWYLYIFVMSLLLAEFTLTSNLAGAVAEWRGFLEEPAGGEHSPAAICKDDSDWFGMVICVFATVIFGDVLQYIFSVILEVTTHVPWQLQTHIPYRLQHFLWLAILVTHRKDGWSLPCSCVTRKLARTSKAGELVSRNFSDGCWPRERERERFQRIWLNRLISCDFTRI